MAKSFISSTYREPSRATRATPLGNIFTDSGRFRTALQQSRSYSCCEIPAEAGHMLSRLIDNPDHVFLEAKSSQMARLQQLLERCHGPNQANDAFLIWLAACHGASLLTFDAPLRHLAPETELVEVIA